MENLIAYLRKTTTVNTWELIERILNERPRPGSHEYLLASMVKVMSQGLIEIHRKGGKTSGFYRGVARKTLFDSGYWRHCKKCNRTLTTTDDENIPQPENTPQPSIPGKD